MDSMNIEEFRQALPAGLKKNVNQSLIDTINKNLSDPDMFETYRENLLSYANIMSKGKFKLSSYIHAVKYVSYKMRDKTNLAAFSLTFPEKIKRWENEGVEQRDVSSYVSAYNKSRLVNLIYEQTLTPSWILNQDIFQKAINKQVQLMNTASSERVQMEAANSLLSHLKPPEKQQIELNISNKDDSAIEALKQTTAELAAKQKQLIEAGIVNAQQIASSELAIDGQYRDISE